MYTLLKTFICELCPVAYQEDDVEKSSTGIDQQEVREARSKAKNTLQFCCRILSERNLLRKALIICHVGMIVERWHSAQNKENRSCADGAVFFARMAAGGYIDHVSSWAGSTPPISQTLASVNIGLLRC